jgi:LDH2 family malate/lactate/ureidoglycolate dehydrogenase
LLVAADLLGVPSHGVLLVPMYVERIPHGSVSLTEEAKALHEFGAIATLDAQHGLGQLSGDQAMRMAVAKARQVFSGRRRRDRHARVGLGTLRNRLAQSSSRN